jgi:hypothetical protein
MTDDTERPAQPLPRGLREIPLVLAGVAAPVAVLVLAVSCGAGMNLSNPPALALILVAELLLGLLSLGLVARRRVRWFAIPCAIFCAGVTLLACSCWAMLGNGFMR